MTSIVERSIRSVVTKGVFAIAKRNQKKMKANGPNPYLTGIHEPMSEELTIEGLHVHGQIPRELDGTYARIGPNPLIVANPAAHHWFTGDGMVHGVRIKDGKALWYRNRWIRSTEVSRALGEAPAPGPRGLHDNVNTNVLGHAGRVFALVEAGSYPVELGAELETVKHNPFDGTLHGAFTAHPHKDPDTGELHSICYSAVDQNNVTYVVVDAHGRVTREQQIAVKHGPSIHDCMITESYVLIFDLPVTFSMKALVAGYAFPYRWNADHPARVGLLQRTSGDIAWCDVDPAYVFHAANAFERDGKVVLDVVAHSSMFAESFAGPSANTSRFERWECDPIQKRVTRTVLNDQPQEFPRCDERLIGKAYQYAYAVGMPRDTNPQFAAAPYLLRHDVVNGGAVRHELGEGRFPGEFVFVAHGEGETNGWLIGLVIDARNATTDLTIIDAANFTGPAVANVTIPHRVPPGFHGNWIPAYTPPPTDAR